MVLNLGHTVDSLGQILKVGRAGPYPHLIGLGGAWVLSVLKVLQVILEFVTSFEMRL